MKKLIISALAIAFAAFAQAATINWSNGFGINAYNQPGDGDAYVGTIYLMVGGQDVANTFMTTVLAAGEDFATEFATQVGSAISSMSHDDFEPAAINVTTTLTGAQSLFVVALDTANQGVYMSEIVDAALAPVGTTYVEFTHDAAYENAAFAAGSAVSGAGWYTAESIPEPTSGLLMLLGMAGLALRRRRA